MAKKGEKIDFRYLIIEAILIVFTVSLALAMNEWRSNVKERKTRDKVLKNILSEIESNKQDLESKLEYHLQTAQNIGNYLSSDSLWSTLEFHSGIEAISGMMTRGISNPNLQSGAWDSAVLSGVVNSFDYDILYTLSNLYQVQETGPNSTWKVMAGFFSESNSFDSGNEKQLALRFQMAFTELYKQEKSLLNDYIRALEVIQKQMD